ncbi:MAG: DEAD/DEAH box helicase [Candidatus Daviesbacteria bacterium]
MVNPELFRLKSAEQLAQQVLDVSNTLGESITQPTIHNESLGISINDLKERFPVRYQAYLNTLRNSRRGEAANFWYARVHTLNALDKYTTTHYSQDEGDRTLFDSQMNAFEALRLSLEGAATDGYIRLPTGSGKTVLFTEFVEATDLRTLVVVPTRLLVRQTEEKFEQFAPSVETGKVHSDAKEWGKQVTITTYSSFLRGVENEKINPTDYDLLILDEAHKSLSLRRIAAVQEFADTIKLGFTATPKYSENRHLGNLLNTEIHRMSIREAIEEGLLASLSVYIAKTDINLSNVRVTSSGEYNDDDLERAINITVRNTAAVDLYKAMFSGQIAVAYCVSIKHAEDLANNFNEGGIPAGAVSSHQNYSEQEEMLHRFRSGELKVICNADILIEGFDDPRVNVCLNLRPTASPVVAEQRAGRVLRSDSENPFKHAYIVDFIDEFGDPNRFPISFAQILEAAHVFRKDSPPEYYRGGTAGIGPVRYPEIEVSGLQVITDAEEVMRVVKEIIDQKYEPVREDWLSFTALNNRFRIGPHTLQRLLKKYRESNSSDFKIFLNSRGRSIEYVSPQLIATIKDIRDKMQAPVEDWMNMPKIEAELNISRPTLENLINEHRKSNPDYFRVFKRDNGQIMEYFSPELVNLIREQAITRNITADTPPADWVTYREAANAAGIDKGTVERFADQYKDKQPEHFGRFKKRKGRNARVGEYVSPVIVGILRGELDKFPQAEEEWVNPRALVKEFDISVVIVRNLAERHRQEQSQDFQILKSKDGKTTEHFSAGLTALLREEITTFLGKPANNWMDRRLIHTELGISKTTVIKKLGEYRKTYPQFFRFFLDLNKKKDLLREYVASELVELLREDVAGGDKVPEGWMGTYDLEQNFGIKAANVRQYVRRYRKSDHEYFKVLVGRQHHLTQYFSPELVELIKNEYLEAVSPPTGWLSADDLGEGLRLSQESVLKILNTYKNTHPELVGLYRGEGHHKIGYYVSPDLTETIRQENTRTADLEPQWLNQTSLVKELGVVSPKISEFVDQFRDEHPEWFRILRGKRNIKSEHYSPELVEKIREHFGNI